MSERLKRNKCNQKDKILNAIEKLKKVRSGESSVLNEVKDEENVYDYVSEDEYTNIIEERNKDWIVDDDGSYFEDGREIFDEDEEIEIKNKEGLTKEYENYGLDKKKVPLKKLKEKCDNILVKNSSIKSFLLLNKKDSVIKKSFNQMNVDDDLLKEILDDINQSSVKKNQEEDCSHLPSSSSFNQINKRKYSNLEENTSNNPFSVKNYEAKKIKCETNLEDELLLDVSNEINEDKMFETKKMENKNNELSFNKEQSTCNDFENIKSDISYKVLEKENRSFSSFSLNEKYLSNLFETNDDGKILNFYYLDLYENTKQPGTIYIIGKVYIENIKAYTSCCLIAKNIEQKIFIYPRTNFKSNSNNVVNIQDVHEEIKEIFTKYQIKNFRSKSCTKFYSFEKEIPSKGEYLEILYTPSKYSLPHDLSGETFNYVFGLSQNYLERFIIDLKLKGPCWLKISNPEPSSPPISWCKMEFILDKPFTQIKINEEHEVEVPLNYIVFNMRTYLNQKTNNNEIILISCLCNSDYLISKNNDKTVPKVNLSFCIITRSPSLKLDFPYDFVKEKLFLLNKKTKIEIVQSERELLNLFMAKLIQIDPDLLIGHDISYELNILISRLAHFKLPVWSKLGRLKRSSNISQQIKERSNITAGRLVCDTKIAAQEFIKANSYDLTELTQKILNSNCFQYDQASLPHYYESSENLLKFIDNSMLDTNFILGIFLELNVMPLYSQITKIAGNLLSRTLLGGKSERNEFLLLHAFNEKNYILPCKKFNSKLNKPQLEGEINKTTMIRKKASYSGGLVLDPKVGFYDKYVLLMDFNSLYPSIIQEYNICFTSINRKSFINSILDMTGEILPDLPNNEGEIGILPIEISKLVESRRNIKKLLCNMDIKPDEKAKLDIKQKALKLIANSIYGCLGFSNSRFYAKPLAALITAKGREILTNTKELAESLGLEVIYGDTDSIMINTNSSNFYEAKNIGSKFQSEINKRYKKLEIEIDGIFRSILLLKKKKYAAVLVVEQNNQITYKTEVKGLDIVRRDWSNIAKRVGENVLSEILSLDKTSEQIIDNIHNYLSSIAKQIQENSLPINVYVITKQLTKNPEDYTDIKGLNHVNIALRRNNDSNTNRKFKAGDAVSYIICKDKENNDFNNLPPTQRCFQIDELKNKINLEIDTKYYLQQQIHPVVSRLCDPIDGTNSHIIAEFLGIQVSNIAKTSKDNDLDYEFQLKNDDSKYDTCKSFFFKCPNSICNEEIQIRSLINKNKSNLNDSSKGTNKSKLTFETCPKCLTDFSDVKYVKYFVNYFRIYINSIINNYYNCWFICEDPICHYKTKCFTNIMSKKGPVCPECNNSVLYPEISDVQLYMQLMFFNDIFDVKKIFNYLSKLESEDKECIENNLKKMQNLYESLYEVVQNYKTRMAYDVIDLGYLFYNQYFSCVKNLL